MKRYATVLLSSCWAMASLLTAGAAEAQLPATSRVSVDVAGADANGASESPSVSADGRFVAFASSATDIAGGDPADGDVFLRDRTAGTTTLVNPDHPGAGLPSVSDDGRYVVYQSQNGGQGPSHVFVRDVVAGTTALVDVALGGGPGNGGALRVSISGDGRHVAFESTASNLVPGDGNDQPDVFVRDLDAGTTVRANVAIGGGDSGFAEFGGRLYADSPDVLSADGRYVVFDSAFPLVPGDNEPPFFDHDIFVRDVVAGVTTLVSDAPEVAVVFSPSISSDGRRVAYVNAQSGFIRGGDVLVRDLATQITVKANVETGEPGSFSFSTPSLSSDGRYVAFDSDPTNQDAGDNTPLDGNVFVRDLLTSTTTRVTLDAAGGEPNGSSFDPAMSGDGSTVAYVSGASDLVPGDGNGLRDVFAADLGTGRVRDGLVALARRIEGFGLPKGSENSLTSKIRAAVAGLDRGKDASACGSLGALANHARALRGKRLTPAQADGIVVEVGRIRRVLGCR